MARPMTPDQWLKALRAEGVTDIVEMPGWRTNNRNHKGSWGDVHATMIHHTAGEGSGLASYCFNGNAALPGPLCHDFLARSGRLHLVGNGRANHAGTVARNAYDAVLNESSHHPAPDAAEPIDGNAVSYGLECENNGQPGRTWTAKQYDVAVRVQAARCRFHGWSADSVWAHKEATRRKPVDPRLPMGQFRQDVADRLAHAASWNPGEKPSKPATPSKPNPIPAPVEDPMPAPTTLHESVAGGPDLPAGEWTELPAAEDTAIVRGPCTYNVAFNATLSGTSDAGRIQFRFVHVDIETRRRSAALPVDVYVRGGDTGTQVSRRGFLPAGQYLKVEALADGAGAAVTHRTVDGLVWR
ncbi:N-acetylmuramoyl-L-alanine amidase [Streptomyces anulatus]|uniref:peptidoglycan recognition protein family protein n=1 Tax=Streptomyces anulatus TaxID=1892 RepID=UPI0033D0EB3B